MKPLKIIFFGTNSFSVEVLKALYENKKLGFEIVCVCTKCAKPFGPKHILKDSEVFEYATRHNIPVKTYKTLKKEENQNDLNAFSADMGIVASYGLILPQAVLDMFKYGCINVHGSLLPKYRGSAPIQRAIMDGETKTGITIMQMDAGIDTGDMLLKSEIDISNKYFGEVFNELAQLGGKLLIEYLVNRENIKAIKQDNDSATYANKIENEDCVIDFKKQTAQNIFCKVRALSPNPKTFFFDKMGRKIFILKSKICDDDFDIKEANLKKDIFVLCSDNRYIQLLMLQKEGRKILNSHEFLNGNKLSL